MSEKERYSDAELEEFRKLINDKIAAAQELYDELVEAINNSHGNGTGDTSPTFKALEEAADVNEREANARLAERQRQFISHLRGALTRIETRPMACAACVARSFPRSACALCLMPRYVSTRR